MASLISKYVEILNEEKYEANHKYDNSKKNEIYSNKIDQTITQPNSTHVTKPFTTKKLKKFNDNFLEKLVSSSIFVPKFWFEWINKMTKTYNTLIYKQSQKLNYNKFVYLITEFTNIWLVDNTISYELELQYKLDHVLIDIRSTKVSYCEIKCHYEDFDCSCLISLGVLFEFEKKQVLNFDIPCKLISVLINHGIIIIANMIQNFSDVKVFNNLICNYSTFYVMWNTEIYSLIDYLSTTLRYQSLFSD
jgi:hypothetical protein